MNGLMILAAFLPLLWSPHQDGAFRASNDLDLMQGTWVYESLQLGEHLLIQYGEETENATVCIRGDWHHTMGHVSVLRLDAKALPKQVDFHYVAGAHAGKVVPAIYKIDNGRLSICHSDDERSRPTSFGRRGTVTRVLKRSPVGSMR